MLKKYSIVIGIMISIVLLGIAMMLYPGGSYFDKNSIGYSLTNNFISNLFLENAVNGSHNPGRYWAVAGMMAMSVSFSLFFIEFSKRIPIRSASNVIKYFGIAGMGCTFLIATPLHDIMVTIASTIFLVSIFYIAVFVFKSKLHLFKLLCIIYLLVFYGTLAIFGSGYLLEYLPIIQKILFIISIILIVTLHFFTTKEDFEHIKGKQKRS